MANKQIIEYNASTITNDNDALLFQSSGGVTSKIVWSDIVSKIVSSYFQPGDNITITPSGNVLTFSATDSGKTYSAGAGIDITNNAISFKLGDGLTLNQTTGNIDVTGGGTTATIEVGTTTTGEPGTNASVTNSGTASAAVLNFVIPRGTPGEAATVSVGTVTTGAAGSNASVTNSGTTSAAVFNFTIPRGNVGETGADGQDGASISATISTITGGHRVTLHSTDPETSDTYFDVMDGTEIIQTSSDDRTVTLLASDWQGTSAPYTQTVTVSGMTSSVVPILGLSVSSTVETGLEELSQWGRISRATTGTDIITVYCYESKPTINLNVIVKVV